MQGYHVPHTLKMSKLKLIRIKKRMTQSELSEASGVPIKVIGNYEQLRRDLKRARVDIVYRLALALECTIEELITD